MAEVIAVNRYCVRDAGAFDLAVATLVARVLAEGHRGVGSYQFHRSGLREGRAVVRYSDPEAWVGHHDLITGWPELAAFRAAADLEEVILFGPVSAAMQGWLDRMGLGDRVRLMGPQVAGFVR
jgi:hypothetical protein